MTASEIAQPSSALWRKAIRAPASASLVWPAIVMGILALFGAFGSVPTIKRLDDVLYLGVFAVGTNLLLGSGGLISFGQAVFFGAGAYTIALGWLHYGLPFGVLMVAAPVVGAALAVLVGLVALRTRAFFFALVTLAFSQLAFTGVEHWYGYTGGDTGVFGPMIPRGLADPRGGYWFILAVSFATILVLHRVTRSPFGVTLRAIRDHEQRMRGLGVNVFVHHLLAFAIAGAACAVAGTLAVVTTQTAYPSQFDWLQSGTAVIAASIGGRYLFAGPLVGALILGYGNDIAVNYTTHWQLMLGLLLLASVFLAPDGVAGATRQLWFASKRLLKRPGVLR